VGELRTEAAIDSLIDVLQGTSDPQIPEAFNEGADGRVAVATCDGHTPVIYYSARDVALFDTRTVAFVRQHEFGHHRLRQIDCSGDEPQFPNYDEKGADCWAIDAIRPLGLRGRDMVVAVATIFHYLNRPASDAYPSTRDRAGYLQAGCGTPLPTG
jgi:hypothetical protein